MGHGSRPPTPGRSGNRALDLAPKEGIALINGTQVMTAIGALALIGAERLVEAAEVAGAMRSRRCGGRERRSRRASTTRGRIQASARRPSGCGRSSERPSGIAESHAGAAGAGRLLPPLCRRCTAQCAMRSPMSGRTRGRDQFRDRLPARLRGRPHGERVVSGGNFHGAPRGARRSTSSRSRIADLASISERRTQALMDPAFSEVPAFPTPRAGSRSGFMMYLVTAAALVSECKGLAHPASVDSIPTSANKEDHVSMGVWAARKAAQALENAERVVAIELLAAAQGIDFLRPLESSPPLEVAHRAIRARSPGSIGPARRTRHRGRGRARPWRGAPRSPVNRPRGRLLVLVAPPLRGGLDGLRRGSSGRGPRR